MGAGSLDESKLAARFERQRERLLTSITVSFQTVRRDESDVDELHELRKSMKQLRYLLELVPADRATEELLDRLHGWQDELGEIHDHDMFLSLLREQPPSRLLLQVIGSESSKRRQRYHAFLESYIDSQLQDPPIVPAREDRTEPRIHVNLRSKESPPEWEHGQGSLRPSFFTSGTAPRRPDTVHVITSS